MTLKAIELFVDDCFHRGVDIPKDMVFICSDWNRAVPEEFRDTKVVEYNYRPSDDDVITILITEKKGL